MLNKDVQVVQFDTYRLPAVAIMTLLSYKITALTSGLLMCPQPNAGGQGNPFLLLHKSSSWVKIRVYTKYQLPGYPG